MKRAGWAKWVPAEDPLEGVAAEFAPRPARPARGAASAAVAAIVLGLAPRPGKSKAVAGLGFVTCKEYWSGRRRR